MLEILFGIIEQEKDIELIQIGKGVKLSLSVGAIIFCMEDTKAYTKKYIASSDVQ